MRFCLNRLFAMFDLLSESFVYITYSKIRNPYM